MRRAILTVALLGALALYGHAQTAHSPEKADGMDALRMGGGAGAFVPSQPLQPVTAAPTAAPSTPSDPANAATGGGAENRKEQPVAAKVVFGGLATPAPMKARSIGFYSKGCLAGAEPVPIDGETWQVMRVARNRNWGHPKLVALIERLAEDVAAKDGWQGLLVGDVSQPRGGPMLTGHASHQVGLDADIWLTPMPARRLSAYERDHMGATSMLGKDGVHVDPEVFTIYHAAIIRRAASYPEVERIFVAPGIKKAMCEEPGVDHKDFHKIRPYWGHDAHMHIRIACPPDSPGCKPQPAAAGDDGCGAEVADWIRRVQKPAKPEPHPPVVAQTPSKKHVVTLADLPAECRMVVEASETFASETPKAGATRAAHSQH